MTTEMYLKGSLNWHRANLNCYLKPEPEYRDEVQSPMSQALEFFTVALLEKQAGLITVIATTVDQQNHFQKIQKVLKHRIQKVSNLQTFRYRKSKRGTWQMFRDLYQSIKL